MAGLKAGLYDLGMKPLEKSRIQAIRKRIAGKAEGQVLEIGSGTGANFPLYTEADMVHAIEPDSAMRKKSLIRAKRANVPIKTYEAKAEGLPFPEDMFDTVVATLVFCTIPQPEKALQEIRRVSKPGASVLFFEHVRSDNGKAGRLQDALTPLWQKVAGGCQLNRDTLRTIQQSGLTVVRATPSYKGLFLEIECINEK
jgi:ubiquinone/menaquinone biosynthesis C-methylase UbiE